MDNVLLDENGAARHLGVAAQTLAIWRCKRRYNLPYVKVGRSVRYLRRDLDAFIERGRKLGCLPEALDAQERDAATNPASHADCTE